MKSAIYNLYVRKSNMETTIAQAKENVERNNAVINAIEALPKETKEKYDLEKFVESVKNENDSTESQVKSLEEMLECGKNVIKEYEADKEKYEHILNEMLMSFGYHSCEDENHKESK